MTIRSNEEEEYRNIVAELRLRVEILDQVEEELTEDSVEGMAMLVTVLEEEDVDCTTIRGRRRRRRANQWQNLSTFSRRRQHRHETAEPIHEAPRLSRT